MASSREHVVTVQRSTDVSHDAESVQEFLNNLSLSDLFNHPDKSVAMNSFISSAVRVGDFKYLLEEVGRYGTPMACFKNDKGDTILHLAASLGYTELVKRIIVECPSLLLETNRWDQIPLHVAAHAGHLEVVKFIATSVAFIPAQLPEEDRERLSLYGVKDINGDTPLHLALKDFPKKTEKLLLDLTTFLVEANRRVSFLANKDGISPLYLAVKAGNLTLVNAMLRCPGNSANGSTSDLASKLEGKKSLVHAALMAKNKDILHVILTADRSLVKERHEGQTCFSVGASVGFCEGIKKLIEEIPNLSIFECDKDGSFPIHKAVENGHKDVVRELIRQFPSSREQLNEKGQNILHIAAMSAKSRKTVDCIMDLIGNKKVTNRLLVERDVDGNTPLHLATIYWRPRTVDHLTRWSTEDHLNIQNKDGLRALDIAEINLQSNYIFRERLTLMVLLCVYKPKGFSWTPTSGMTLRSKSDHVEREKYKGCVDVLLLVAALVATVTFAAGFTMPGGFNSSAPDAGMAILVDSRGLSGFLICDTLALQSSVIAIIALIWAQLGDQELVHRALHLALPSLFFALLCMSLAFCCGVLATITSSTSLFLTIYCICTITTVMMGMLLTPYVVPQSSIPLIHLFCNRYLRLLLWLVNEDDASDSRHTRLEISSRDQEVSSRDQEEN